MAGVSKSQPQRKIESLSFKVGSSTIVSKRAIKYLGVMIDDRLNFKSHMEYACKKASTVSNALARMMPNIGGPRQSRRMLLSRVTNSILLYGAPVWAKMIKKSAKKDMISLFRRSCLRVCSGYRTISLEAASVISGMVPIDITTNEQFAIYNGLKNSPHVDKKILSISEREKSMQSWQRRWENSQNGRWTFKLIPNIKMWFNRKHGEINYNLTQFLSGHGGYRSYLHRFGHDISPRCPECPNEDENAEHVVFHCPRFISQRQQLEVCVGENLSPGNVIAVMVRSENNWDAIKTFIDSVSYSLRVAEKNRKAEAASSS